MHITKDYITRSQLKKGINLYHQKFEQGKILRVQDNYAEIKFYGVGIKRLNIDTCIKNQLFTIN
ncbi:MAG: hypothetical protein N4A54_03235 [Peptostreptococcaceae bacterium]|jgi:hypothetical protein|nr:hypothetical protein [Peptostreptococcaceae bacterium]